MEESPFRNYPKVVHHAFRFILLLEPSRFYEASLCMFYRLLLFYLLFSLLFSLLLSISFIYESLQLFLRWIEGRRTLPPFYVLRFLGINRLLFYMEEKILLRLVRTSPLDFYFDYLRG
jgi:hypothetical protein